ncbi:Putative Holliday junction resolvase [Caulifigura coniformis]|uniref:Putative pre-16S rRNA nuclease n=1 Tax=Caulifigura coniformis TaxID=2527983 RepID=A0A517S919_9PLAN|nr:Holliday junction resolvase RuvX [Caulifigura coniformis]QDT52603.1 Putative Holliday junction resolvase [Caulifigura coniformis]
MSETLDFPGEGRLLGLDFGTVRIGVAISTPEQTIASPMEIYARRNERLDTAYFQTLIKENRIAGAVIGLPMHVNGDEGESAQLAREFGRWLTAITNRPVTFWDERYTSAVAADMLRDAGVARSKRKQRLDMLAAQILLQSYLDEQIRRREPPYVPEAIERDVD